MHGRANAAGPHGLRHSVATLSRRELLLAGSLLTAGGMTAPGLAARRAVGRDIEFSDNGASTGWLRFDFHQESRILLPVRVNGTLVHALVDSGSTHVVLDSAFAQQIGLRAGRSLPTHGLSSSTQGRIARDPVEVEIGNLKLVSRVPLLLDMADLSTLMGRPLQMLLGRELFERLLVDIDFPSRTIAFHDPGRFKPPEGAAAVTLSRSAGLRTVQVSVEGQAEVPGTFDLGKGGSISLSPLYAREKGLLDQRPTTSTMSAGVEGRSLDTMIMLRHLSIGATRLGPMPAVVHTDWSNDRRGRGAPVQLGIELFRRFRLITDYPGDRLWLIPDPAALAEPFNRDRAGLVTVARRDRLEVVHVRRGSPAERAGFREGNEVVGIDGAKIDADYLSGRLWRWVYGPAGTSVRLNMVDGTIRSLTLQDYF